MNVRIIAQIKAEPKRCPHCVVFDGKSEGEWLKCRVHGGCVECNWTGFYEFGAPVGGVVVDTMCCCFEGVR